MADIKQGHAMSMDHLFNYSKSPTLISMSKAFCIICLPCITLSFLSACNLEDDSQEPSSKRGHANYDKLWVGHLATEASPFAIEKLVEFGTNKTFEDKGREFKWLPVASDSAAVADAQVLPPSVITKNGATMVALVEMSMNDIEGPLELGISRPFRDAQGMARLGIEFLHEEQRKQLSALTSPRMLDDKQISRHLVVAIDGTIWTLAAISANLRNAVFIWSDDIEPLERVYQNLTSN